MPRAVALLALLAPAAFLGPAPETAPQPTASPQPHASPLGLAVDATGKIAYVALHGRAAVALVDLQAGKVLREIAVDAGPYDLAATADTVYVTCADGDSLVLLDRA